MLRQCEAEGCGLAAAEEVFGFALCITHAEQLKAKCCRNPQCKRDDGMPAERRPKSLFCSNACRKAAAWRASRVNQPPKKRGRPLLYHGARPSTPKERKLRWRIKKIEARDRANQENPLFRILQEREQQRREREEERRERRLARRKRQRDYREATGHQTPWLKKLLEKNALEEAEYARAPRKCFCCGGSLDEPGGKCWRLRCTRAKCQTCDLCSACCRCDAG